jgi:uncharacterized membrane protein SirB2
METFNQVVLYFFSPLPGRDFDYYIPLIGLIAAILIASFYISIYIKKNKDNKAFKKTFRGFPSKLQLMAFLLGIYVLFRYYYVPFFSMRFILYILILITFYLLYLLAQAYRKTYPAEKEMRAHRQKVNEYLPETIKKKKKKK